MRAADLDETSRGPIRHRPCGPEYRLRRCQMSHKNARSNCGRSLRKTYSSPPSHRKNRVSTRRARRVLSCPQSRDMRGLAIHRSLSGRAMRYMARCRSMCIETAPIRAGRAERSDENREMSTSDFAKELAPFPSNRGCCHGRRIFPNRSIPVPVWSDLPCDSCINRPSCRARQPRASA